MIACGIDYGTSNSAACLYKDGQVVPCLFESGKTELPTAVFFDFEEHAIYYGREAVAAYTEGAEGRLMRALKSLLGSSLINESTSLKKSRVTFQQVIELYLANLKKVIEATAGGPVEQVTMGRPVRFVDDNPDADQEAENSLRQAAETVGFKDISFAYEPVGALHGSLDASLAGKRILVCDIGGGTADFTLAEVIQTGSELGLNFLATKGVHIGGTDLDKEVSLECIMPEYGRGTLMSDEFKFKVIPVPENIFASLSTWHRINSLYSKQALSDIRAIKRLSHKPELLDRLDQIVSKKLGHASLIKAESLKIALKDSRFVNLELEFLVPKVSQDFSANEINAVLVEPIEKIISTAIATAHEAGLQANQIDCLMLTGGTSLLQLFRDQIQAAFPTASILDSDTYTSVAKGLALMSGKS